MGIGIANQKQSDGMCTYIVARYRPSGNVKGEFRENVVKALADIGTCSDVDFLAEKASHDLQRHLIVQLGDPKFMDELAKAEQEQRNLNGKFDLIIHFFL